MTEQHDSDLKFSVILLHLVVMSDDKFCVNERESDDSSQTNLSLEIWIIILRLGFGVLGLGF